MPATPSPFIDKHRLLKAPFYFYGGVSGLATVIAAGTATAGHVYVLRNPTASARKVHVSRFRLTVEPRTAFGAAQALAFALYKMTGYSAAHAGGTAITPAKRITSEADASVAAARIATTGELTAGTHVVAAQPITRFASTHSTLPLLDQNYVPRDDHPLVLEPGEGLLLRNETLMGASGVVILGVDCDGWER